MKNTHKKMKNTYKGLFLITLCFSIIISAQTTSKKTRKVYKTDTEWRKTLTEKEYYVLREKGTERPFKGKYNKFYKKGIYVCKGCNTPLYKSENKFDSGTGWPSFDRGIEVNLTYKKDRSFGIDRIEICCAVCAGHLGHIFDDGPKKTTGKRHCINSVSLKFIAKDKK